MFTKGFEKVAAIKLADSVFGKAFTTPAGGLLRGGQGMASAMTGKAVTPPKPAPANVSPPNSG